MGLFDWLLGRKKGSTPSNAATSGTGADRSQESEEMVDKREVKKLKKELENEKKRNSAQEARMLEMEEKFTDLQQKWARMIEKQQATVSKLMGEKKTSSVYDQEPDHEYKDRPDRYQHRPEKRPLKKFSSPIIAEKTFDNFVVDDSNRFPYLASEAVATGEGKKYNPLFVYGPVGVGKTHLLHAIANRMMARDPDLNVVYSSTERFTDELIRSLTKDDIQGFREMYQNIDVILVDDIQMLSGREATQKEFFHMFNHLFNSGKQIVLCSDRPPSDIVELESRLRSRFEGGLIIDIQVPTFEGRRQILVNMAQKEGYSISTEVLDYLAFYLDSSVRELEGGFNRVTAYASLMKEPITVNLVRRVLEGILQKREMVRRDLDIQKEEHRKYAEEERGKDISKMKNDELELEEETEMIEKELLFELKKGTG